jgi:hypothetical protein
MQTRVLLRQIIKHLYQLFAISISINFPMMIIDFDNIYYAIKKSKNALGIPNYGKYLILSCMVFIKKADIQPIEFKLLRSIKIVF